MTQAIATTRELLPLTEKEWGSLGFSPDKRPEFDKEGTEYKKLEKFFEKYSKLLFPTSLTQVMYHHEKPHRDILYYSCNLLYASVKIGAGISDKVSLKTPADTREALKAQAFQRTCQNAIVRIQEATDKYFKPKEESK